MIRAVIDLGAVGRNARELARLARPGARLMAVVKADAYGHGAVPVAKTALQNGAEWLGVARLEEAVQLRRAGIGAPILVFGPTPPEAAGRLVENDLRQSVFSLETAAAYAAHARRRGRRIALHLKVDTGMGRLGLLPAALAAPGSGDRLGEAFRREVAAIARLSGTELEGVFTHFASADASDLSAARGQLALFEEILAALAADGIEFGLRHAANSAALIALPEARLDLVRPGIALYGLPPSPEIDLGSVRLAPAMTLVTRIAHLKAVPAGFAVSYGMTYRTPAPTLVATVPAGYADGYSRRFSSAGAMLVRGVAAPVIGRVCMDLTMLDVGGVPGVAVGDEAVIFGRQAGAEITAAEIARRLDTIPYEVVCAVAARVPREYRAGETG
jgi:alanine racemase